MRIAAGGSSYRESQPGGHYYRKPVLHTFLWAEGYYIRNLNLIAETCFSYLRKVTSGFAIETCFNQGGIMHTNNNKKYAEKFIKLLDIMDKLRGENGCPWDLEQDHKTLLPYIVEETYETVEAIEEENPNKIAEELGDVMLQIVFHSRLGKESGDFNVGDVLDSINNKMIRRHPHIFGDVKVNNSREVLQNWEEIKMKEKGTTPRKSLLDGIPRELPALLKAKRLQERAAEVGFDWPEIDGVVDKIEEEIGELREALQTKEKEKITDEMGDLLFALVNIGRWMNINPEEALRRTNKKFIRRFKYIENYARENNLDLNEMDVWAMEEIWQESKREEK